MVRAPPGTLVFPHARTVPGVWFLNGFYLTVIHEPSVSMLISRLVEGTMLPPRLPRPSVGLMQPLCHVFSRPCESDESMLYDSLGGTEFMLLKA